MGFANALTFTGSGGIVTPDGLLLATPTHTLEALYILQTRSSMLCSNSLAFLLTQADDGIDAAYRFYDTDIMSIIHGLRRFRSTIPTRRHNQVSLYYYCRILIAEDLTLRVLPKSASAPFANFYEYRGFLQEQVAMVVENAADAARKTKYMPLATISTGYDSNASAVIGVGAGCRAAITFRNGRDNDGTDTDDSGKHIGELLGLTVQEWDVNAYKARSDLPEAEFLATGSGGGDVFLTAAEDLLTGRLLLTGYYGDVAWDRLMNTGGPDMARYDLSGTDLIYFRTRVGFLHLPVPSIGYIQHQAIYSISNSEEMRPWSVESESYDRPIPRRIVEEAGIPRGVFGLQKKQVAPTVRYTYPYTRMEPNLETVMSTASLRDFRTWSRASVRAESWRDRMRFCVMHALYRLNLRLLRSKALRAVAGSLGKRGPTTGVEAYAGLIGVPWISSSFSKRPTEHRLLFHWGMERVSARYARMRPTIQAQRRGASGP
jgi:hypothetical protein